jgi:uncharacterized protein YceK
VGVTPIAQSINKFDVLVDWRTLFCLILVVLAGCSTSVGSQAPGEQPRQSQAGTQGTQTPGNPWANATLTVGLAVTGNDTARYRALAADALAFWEAHAEEYVGYAVAFRLDPNASEPPIQIDVTPAIRSCGNERHVAGCAPHVDDPRHATTPIDVRVKGGFTNNSTLAVLQHELGHVLGLDHDDEPRDVMRAKRQLVPTPQPDATNRSVPWDDSTVTVYVDDDRLSPSTRAAVDSQLANTFAYYERGANGSVTAQVAIERVSAKARADVVVTFTSNLSCAASPPASCGTIQGTDSDHDGSVETYSRLSIELSGLDDDVVGWHVGRWLAPAFGLDRPDELPTAFTDTGPAERRADWWNDSHDGDAWFDEF